MRQDRIESGLDQESLAEVLGLNPSTISSWENGKRTPKVAHLVRFSDTISEDPKKYVIGDALRQVSLFLSKRAGVQDFARQVK